MASESGLKSRILEMVRTTKEQKEPLLAGSEYKLTKQVTQAYGEAIEYSKQKVAMYEAEAKTFATQPRNCRLVGPGHKVKGYALVISVHDDYDMSAELDSIIECLRETHSLQEYLDVPTSRGKMKLYPYVIEELSIIFPEFFAYNLVEELERLKKGLEASYGRQVYAGTVSKLQLAIGWEVNHAMTTGNSELAERLKESDTTLLVSLAAGAEQDSKPAKHVRPEPTREEVEHALQEMALKDLEIRTPSSIPGPESVDDQSVAIDTVNVRRNHAKKKVAKKTASKPAKEKATA